VTGVRRGIAITGHWLPLRAVQGLARCAEGHGFEVLFVDGDTADVPSRDDAVLYEATALQAAALAATSRLRVGSIRLPGFAPVVAQARSLAALQALSGGRALAFFGVGSGRDLKTIGLAKQSVRQRIAELDESLGALRALFTGRRVTLRGQHVRLEGARSAPCDPAAPLIVAAAQSRALQVVARHADVWDANVPALPECLQTARARLERAMETWIWVFARPDAAAARAAHAYRRHCPWFRGLPEHRVPEALLCGDPRAWPERLAELAERLRVDLVVLDLIGLEEQAARRAIQAFPAAPAAPGARMS
jgi:alkanesulfonate monooxygenase SsuD/methylene tetrahydromethanopterin reductase-like flavin-dependent oxidoreductase (luciferase family)